MVRPAHPRLRAGAVVLLALGCFPGPLDESGRTCDPTHSCSTGYLCFDGLCAQPGDIDAGPDNWVDNGGFERVNDAGTDPVTWRALPASGDIATDTTLPFEGARVVRLFCTLCDGGDQPGVQQAAVNAPVRDTVAGQTWCARAAVRSSSTDGGVSAQLFVRERTDAGTTLFENEFVRVPIKTSWVPLEVKYVTGGGASRMDVRVVSGGKIHRQDVLWVDDVRLKRSATGECKW